MRIALVVRWQRIGLCKAHARLRCARRQRKAHAGRLARRQRDGAQVAQRAVRIAFQRRVSRLPVVHHTSVCHRFVLVLADGQRRDAVVFRAMPHSLQRHNLALRRIGIGKHQYLQLRQVALHRKRKRQRAVHIGSAVLRAQALYDAPCLYAVGGTRRKLNDLASRAQHRHRVSVLQRFQQRKRALLSHVKPCAVLIGGLHAGGQVKHKGLLAIGSVHGGGAHQHQRHQYGKQQLYPQEQLAFQLLKGSADLGLRAHTLPQQQAGHAGTRRAALEHIERYDGQHRQQRPCAGGIEKMHASTFFLAYQTG